MCGCHTNDDTRVKRIHCDFKENFTISSHGKCFPFILKTFSSPDSVERLSTLQGRRKLENGTFQSCVSFREKLQVKKHKRRFTVTTTGLHIRFT